MCYLGLEKLSELLIQKGANINTANAIGNTPIILSAGKGIHD